MPLSNTLTSISGRNSRASNVSAATGDTRSFRSPPPPLPGSNDTLANAGVLSMLKTSTDTGDIGALSFNSSRLPGVSARTQRSKQQTSKPSASHAHHHHHHYAPSTTSRVSSATRDWDNASNGRQGSFTSMQTMPSTMSEAQAGFAHGHRRPRAAQMPPPRQRDSRSQSLTNAQLPQLHSDHNLKSPGYDNRAYMGPPMPENRQPYIHPGRIKMPSYRSPSPALSDSYVQVPPPPVAPVHMRPLMPAGPRQAVPYTVPYGVVEYEHGAAMYTAPVTSPSVNAGYMPHYTYRQPTASQPMPYGPPRPRPRQQAYPQRMAAPMQIPPQSARPNLVPAAHHMFHNAARMARHLPPRADTPILEMAVPSSDPPSSGDTAPTASSPPTPQDWTHLQVSVDPAYIDPALTDLPESASDPVIPARYFDYIDGLERVIDESEMESPRALIPASGFVQRVKAMLESKSVPDSTEHKNELVLRPIQDVDRRITIIEEFQAPAELPASPVRIAELEGTALGLQSSLALDLVHVELPATMSLTESTRQLAVGEGAASDNIDVRPAISPFEEEEISMQQTTDIPSSPPGMRQVSEQSTPQHLTAVASTHDYAMRFTVPSDDTTANLGETETESQDRFILDADTITAQHQVMKDSMHRMQISAIKEAVSPLVASDLVKAHYSEVSPLQTQVAGLDSTMQAARVSNQDVNKMLEAAHEPPTPRTPRTHSKSINIPSSTGTPSSVPNPNRLSLPADFTTSTTDTSTDAMTDIAVRFSIPATTVSLDKPQIIHISSSNSPASREDSQSIHQQHPSIDKKAKRLGVAFEDDISAARPARPASATHHHTKSASSFKRPSRKAEEIASYEPMSEQVLHDRDDSFDARVPVAAMMRSKYLGPHLSDLKEESLEDISLRGSKHSMEMVKSMQFQLPARIAAVKAMQERKQQEQEERAKLRESHLRIHEQAGRPLADLRDLPSLNFSRTDLIDQLNEALHVRTIKSVDILRRRDLSPIYCPSPQRPQSTEPLRERYMSFFDRPEDFPSEIGSDMDDVEATDVLDPVDESSNDGGYLLNVASQVNRMSIPSVAGLSERLAELLPSLKHLNLGSILNTDGEVARTIEDIHNLGQIPRTPRPDTVMTNRTSAGFRTLAERAEEIVRNGTHDSVAPVSTSLRLNKDLPDIPASASADRITAFLNDGKTSRLSNSASAPSDLGKQPSRPCSALVRYRPPSSQEEVRQMLPPEMNPISRASKRSMMSGSKLAIDLTIPSKTHHRESIVSMLSRERGTRSLDLTATGTGFGNTTLASTSTEGNLTSATDHSTSRSNLAKSAKQLVLGSIKCRLTRTHDPEHPARKTLSVTRSASEDHPHDPGDRYPTTALSNPAAYNIDEVYSHFSDDSSERERRLNSRARRWTALKSKHRVTAPAQQNRLPSLDGGVTESLTIPQATIQHRHERVGAQSAARTIPGPAGMGRAEYKFKRFGEKVRNLLARGGELLRSLSTRSRAHRPRTTRSAWLEDSLYSGV